MDLGELFSESELKNSYISEFMLTRPIKSILREHAISNENIASMLLLINIMIRFEKIVSELNDNQEEFLKVRSVKKQFEIILDYHSEFISALMNEELIKTYLEVNEFEGELYFNKEKFEDLSLLLFIWISRRYYDIVIKKKTSKGILRKEYVRFTKKIFSIKVFLDRQAVVSKFHFNVLCENWGLEKD